MPQVLVTYASKHGATKEIAEYITAIMQQKIKAVDCIETYLVRDIKSYDAIVIGTAIYAGIWLSDTLAFLRDHQDILSTRPTWVFASGPTGEGEPEELLERNFVPVQADQLLKTIQPRETVLFHGKVDMKALSWAERLIIRAINEPIGDYRDMDMIRQWTAHITNELIIQPA